MGCRVEACSGVGIRAQGCIRQGCGPGIEA